MTRTLASLILLLVASPLWADIPTYRVGDKIILEAGFEADDYDWRIAGAQLLELDNGKSVAVWAAPGRKYDWDVSGAIVVDGKGQVKRNGGEFTVTSDPAPPTPATLRDLVSDSEAKLIAEFYRDFAANIQFVTPDNFWPVHDAKFPVKGNKKLDAALRKRLEPAVEKKVGLSIELRAIADEFDKESPRPDPPTPSVAPIPEPGLHVLIVEETEDRLKLPEGQRDIITATEWRASWMAKGGEIRMRDPSDEHPNDAAKWNKAMQRPRSGLPWVIISNGTTGYEGPLPDSLTEWEALLAKYGG
jgi:hypothetical protein